MHVWHVAPVTIGASGAFETEVSVCGGDEFPDDGAAGDHEESCELAELFVAFGGQDGVEGVDVFGHGGDSCVGYVDSGLVERNLWCVEGLHVGDDSMKCGEMSREMWSWNV